MINYDALEKIRKRWSIDAADGYCDEIAEDVVDACGGTLLQYYSARNKISGYHYNPVNFCNVGAECIYTPFCGKWKNEYGFHTVALIGEFVVDLFYPDPASDIRATVMSFQEYKNIVQAHNTQEIVFYKN